MKLNVAKNGWSFDIQKMDYLQTQKGIYLNPTLNVMAFAAYS